ncbi:hypothetical protein BZA05DRAFT_476056 [Tricharina praecox]|uniref:uncharacterized protein n=1 Tax=Tricharina praecox TaxID=43433 RepID=UPI0022202036|nr:uncharacterized protein BZA05DRAFT_476056 [Tricharina praecox]KAI5846713.1 hypothetical protein BZA05DRAFT_476056 [Tricharina praecox]
MDNRTPKYPTTYYPPRRPRRGVGHWVPHALTVEPAIAADIPSIVSIICRYAPKIDPRFDGIFPRRTRFPGDFRQFITERLTEFFESPQYHLLSAVIHIDGQDPRCGCPVERPGTLVVGFALWERVGRGKQLEIIEKISGYGWLTRLVRIIAATVTAPLAFNLAVNHEEYEAYVAAREMQDAEFSIYHAEHWRLHAVVVNPRWSSWGVGKKLISWGLDKAREDDVAVEAETTPLGTHCEELFVRLGFTRFGKFMPTVNGVFMGTTMRWQPWMSPPKMRMAKLDAGAEKVGEKKKPLVRTEPEVCTCYG